MNLLILKMFPRLVIYSLLTLVLLSLYFFYSYIHPKRFISNIAPSDSGLEYEDVTLLTKDNLKLAGWFIPQKKSNKAIIICHGYPADKGDVLSLATFLAGHYNLLFFDFRGLGRSQGRFTSGGWKEREDFLSAIRFLKERGFSHLGALGFSLGAAVILMADSKDLKAIVSDSSYASLDSVLKLIFQNFGLIRPPFVGMMKFWARLFFKIDVDRVSPLEHISEIRTPIFLIHSLRDTQIPVEHVYLLHKENPKNLLWVIPEADHGEGFFLKQEEYQKRVLNFFQNNL